MQSAVVGPASRNENHLGNGDNESVASVSAEQSLLCSNFRIERGRDKAASTTNGQMNGSRHSDPEIVQRRPSRVTLARTFWEEHCVYLPAMLGWFLFSALLSAYNKSVFGAEHFHFPCPLLMTSIHFLAQWGFSHAASELAPEFFGAPRIRTMSWREWIAISVPCGTVTSGDVGLSNLSLVRISITFYTMVKASTPIFVLLWAYFLGIEKITPALVLVVVVIAAGEFLTVTGEGGNLDVLGFVLCLMASMLSGARWTLVQLKLRTLEPPLKTTIATMRVLSPSMFASLFLISLAVEEPWKRLAGSDARELGKILGLGLIGAILAISMVLCEFWLIMRSNAIVLMIGGVLKEMVTIMIGVYYFHDKLNTVNITGCLVVFMGVIIYKVTHYIEAQQRKMEINYVVTRTDTGEEDEVDDNDDGAVVMGEDSESPLTLSNGNHDTLDLCKSDSGYDNAAAPLYSDERDGIFMHKPGSEGIELRRKQVVAQVHPPSPSTSNAHLEKTNGLVCSSINIA